MRFLLTLTAICFLLSLFADSRKTWLGVKLGLKMFGKILPSIISVLILVSILLTFIPNEVIVEYLGSEAGFSAYLAAAILGSVSLIPGFIAYPLAGALLKSGVGYPVLAIFITTLTMVGLLTLPIEIKYFGRRVAILRNVLFFIAAILIGTFIGLAI